MKFIKEFFNRLTLKTPPFFIVIQKIAVVAGILAGLPLIINQFQSELHIILPIWITGIASKIALICSVIVYIVAKLPVQNSISPVVVTSLPFTESKNS